MPILLYHGSGQYFEQPDIEKGRDFVDFGKGFYLTTYQQQAQKWAFQKLSPHDAGAVAYIYMYRFDLERLEELNVLKLLKYDKLWLDFVAEARSSLDVGTEYDLIYDKMADGTPDKTIRQYKFHQISAHEALEKLRFSSSRDQYCFKSTKALNMLHRLRYADIHRGDGREPVVNWHSIGGNAND